MNYEPPDFLTVLTTDGGLATKQIRPHRTGKLIITPYGRAYLFRVYERPVSRIAQLAAALDGLTSRPLSFVIRGAPLPGIDRDRCRRLRYPDPENGDPATFGDTKHHWFAVDLDKLARPAAIDPSADPDGAIEYLIGLLPPELHDASAWWQWTSSQGLPGTESTLSARLWFWSLDPLGDEELNRWCKSANQRAGFRLIDPVLYRPVQPHYVAAPIFNGLPDPLPRRHGLRWGLDNAVSLVIPEPERAYHYVGRTRFAIGRGVLALLQEIGGPRGFRAPMLSTVASYFGTHGPNADREIIKAIVRGAIDAAPPGGRSAADLDRSIRPASRRNGAMVRWAREVKTTATILHPHRHAPGQEVVMVAMAIDSPDYSEDFLALEFTVAYEADLRFVPKWGKWMRWDGARWREDTTLMAFDRARKIVRQYAVEMASVGGNSPNEPKRLASAKTVAAVEKLARSDQALACPVDIWDLDAWLFNGPDDVVELETGNHVPHDPLLYMTKVAATSPGGDCPLWLTFLDRVTAGDMDLQAYLRRVAGYCLTGSTRDHSMFFLYGTGANGKGVFLNTLRAVWGDYAVVAAMETFIETHGERHPTDLAMLRGARLVIAQETEKGRHWAESKISALTGGDPISARFMRQDFFEYAPQFKLIIAGNHKPALKTVNEAIRRRINLIPFCVTIPERHRLERARRIDVVVPNGEIPFARPLALDRDQRKAGGEEAAARLVDRRKLANVWLIPDPGRPIGSSAKAVAQDRRTLAGHRVALLRLIAAADAIRYRLCHVG
jgi:P4 family phage/plasmid primase-like protien